LKVSVALFAVDAGPRHVMRALSESSIFETALVERDIFEDVIGDGTVPEFFSNEFDAWVVGTSGSDDGQTVETIIRKQANTFSKLLIVIEDYPGNFKYIEGGQPNLLVVEHESIEAHHKELLGPNCPTISVRRNPRYDQLRLFYSQQQLDSKACNDSIVVLWAGQPETEDAVIVLSRLIPTLKEQNIGLLFSAHPRDKGYPSEYESLFVQHNMEWSDVTGVSLNDCIVKHAPLAVITQYSSVAIEAGFYGVPSVNVLYSDVGAKRLFQDKSFKVLPWCSLGASMIIETIQEQ